ncbi:MAG: cohesin domain-containing protein [Bacteroidota bacterium]
MKTTIKIIFLAILFGLTFSLTFSQSNWTRYAGNPVLIAAGSDPNQMIYAYEPSVLFDSVQHIYKMWFISNTGNQNCISYAISQDGLNWSLYAGNPVLLKGLPGDFDGYSISSPSVIFNGAAYTMYYTGNSSSLISSIGMATSTDGINWTKHNQPVLTGTLASWNSAFVSYPNVYFDGNKYYMWYTGSNGSISRIGLATSPDGIAWTNDANNPVLTASLSGWDSQDLTGSTVTKIGNTFYMFYLGDSTGVCCSQNMGYAFSNDGVHWLKSVNNPIFKPQPNSWDDLSLGSVSVLDINDTLRLWYSAEHGASWQTGYATSILSESGIPGNTIRLKVGRTHAFKHDTVTVALHADFPNGKSYSSCQFILSGFEQHGLAFLNLDTVKTIIGSNGWNYQFNNNDSTLLIASAGAQDIFGGGNLFNFKFLVDGDPIKTVPINIVSAIFNTGADSVAWTNGGIDILRPMPGDVDLSGVVQAYDASLILKYLVGLDTLDHCQLTNADVTGDSSVSAADARSILRYVVGLITSFPDTLTHGLVASGTVQLSPIHAQTGDIISFMVNLDEAQNLISSEGLLKYDKTILQYVGTGSSDLLDSFITNNTPGEIRFAGYKNDVANQSGKLMVIKFKVLGLSGRTTISLNKLRLNEGRVVENAGSSDVILGVADTPDALPVQYALEQNYPNPFNPSTNIRYQLPQQSHVLIKIYNLLGQEVATLVDEVQSAGFKSVSFNANNFPSGVYICQLHAGIYTDVKKIVLMK